MLLAFRKLVIRLEAGREAPNPKPLNPEALNPKALKPLSPKPLNP